jgi:Flp pilus assembly protein TadG
MGRLLGSHEERGNALVEMVIVLPLLLALVFGIITFGTAHEEKVSLTNAAREGARYGATLPYSATWYTQVKAVVTASATGDLSVGGATFCIAYYDGSAWHGDAGQCNDSLTDPHVSVYVTRPGTIETFFFKRSVTLKGSAIARFEATS